MKILSHAESIAAKKERHLTWLAECAKADSQINSEPDLSDLDRYRIRKRVAAKKKFDEMTPKEKRAHRKKRKAWRDKRLQRKESK
mgnify:FL=1